MFVVLLCVVWLMESVGVGWGCRLVVCGMVVFG